MKKIALFGGTGQTGLILLKLALSEGYQIRALARTPEKVRFTHPNLEIVKGDILHIDDVRQCVHGCNVVMSVFGHVKDSPEWLQSTGTQNILLAMKEQGITKIVSLSGGGLPYPERDQPKLIDKFIRTVMKLAVPKILNDAIKHYNILAESSCKWIIVRAPRLTNEHRKGSYRVGWVGVNASTKISRADLADFLLKQIEDETFLYQMPFVSY